MIKMTRPLMPEEGEETMRLVACLVFQWKLRARSYQAFLFHTKVQSADHRVTLHDGRNT